MAVFMRKRPRVTPSAISTQAIVVTEPAVYQVAPDPITIVMPALATSNVQVINPYESGYPTAPTEYVVPTAPATYAALTAGKTVHRPANSAALTTLLTTNLGTPGNLNPGDVIELDPAVTYAGQFKFPDLRTWGDTWTWVVSKNYDSLPATGTRVTAADDANLAAVNQIATGGGAFQWGAMWLPYNSNKWRFCGIKSTSATSGRTSLGVFVAGYNAYDMTLPAGSLSQLPTDVIIDRCHFYGRDVSGQPDRYGVMWNVKGGAIIDSTIDKMSNFASDAAIGVYEFMGGGNVLIQNNSISASGHSYLSGGTDSAFANPNPYDHVFRKNYFYKLRKWFPSHATYDGYSRSIKNLFELKKMQRAVIENNIFEDCGRDDTSQNASGIVLTPINQAGSDLDAQIADIEIRNNIIRYVGNAIRWTTSCVAGAPSGPSLELQRWWIRNNLIYDVNYWRHQQTVKTIAAWPALTGGNGNKGYDLRITHNTILLGPNGENSTYGPILNLAGSGGAYTQYDGFVFRDNLCGGGNQSSDFRPHVYFRSYVNNVAAAIEVECDRWDFSNNVFFDHYGSNGVTCTGQPTTYPAPYNTVAWFPTKAQVIFKDWDTYDFELHASSPYKAGGAYDASDGTDVGCDVVGVLAATAGCITGVW